MTYNVIFTDDYGMSAGVGVANGLTDLKDCIEFAQKNLVDKGLKGKITVTTDDNIEAFTALVDKAVEAQRQYEEMLLAEQEEVCEDYDDESEEDEEQTYIHHMTMSHSDPNHTSKEDILKQISELMKKL